MSKLNRRRFLEDSILATAAVAAAGSTLLAADDNRPVSPNNKITVAIIGCGIRGKQHALELLKLADCEIAYVCDPDSKRAADVAAVIVEQNRPAPKVVQDMRTVFDDKSVDAVFIATCNHWHALAAIWAMQAGKDAYVEKPVSHNVSEGRRIVQVARKGGRICQGGTQNRSNGALAAAIDYVKQGKLGEVKLARSVVYGKRAPIGMAGKCDVPSSVDFNLWAGPASDKPLTRPKFHYDWHWMWNTGNGELGNNNIHSLDICRWGLGVTGLGQSVISYGGRFGDHDVGETPNTQVCVFDFGDKAIVSETRGLKSEAFHPNFKGGWILYGTEGIISGQSLFNLKGELVSTFEGKTESHFANFLKAMRSRKREELNAEILEGHQSTGLCHIGNISWRLGKEVSVNEVRDELTKLKLPGDALETLDRTTQHLRDNNVDLGQMKVTLGTQLRLDRDREAFIGNPEADAFLTREYRKPFVVPLESEV